MNNHQRISETVTWVVCCAVRSCFSHVRLFVAPGTAARQASLSFTISRGLFSHVHWVGDVVQPSHPLLPPSPPALNLSQHQGLSQLVGPSQQVASVLPMNIQFISFRIDWFDLLAVKELSRVFSGTWRACENAGFRSPARNIKVLQVTYWFDVLLDAVSRKNRGPSIPTASASVSSTNNSVHLVESMDAEPGNMEGPLYYAIYIKDLSIHWFWYPQRSWNQSPMATKGWLWVYGTCYIKHKQINTNNENNISKEGWVWGGGVGCS